MDSTRRQWITGIGAAVVFLTSACSVFRNRSEIDEVSDELESLLRQTGAADQDELLSIAEEIRRQSHALLDAHNSFADEFNRLATDRTIAADELYDRVEDYELERISLRNELLETQDRLHAAVPEDQWARVLELLNQKSSAISSRRGAGG